MNFNSIPALPPHLLEQVLRDPILMQQVSDRVYDLLQADLRQQRERTLGHGR